MKEPCNVCGKEIELDDKKFWYSDVSGLVCCECWAKKKEKENDR